MATREKWNKEAKKKKKPTPFCFFDKTDGIGA